MMFYIVQTIAATIMFYSLTNNHYIGPLHPCLMAKICNHTGLKMCGSEKNQRDMRLFLDDCDMFEYNCDYKKAYSKVDDKLCKEDITESNTEKTLTSAKEESTSVNVSSPTSTADKSTSNVTTIKITQTQPQSETITILTKPMTSVSGTTTAKCTCMDLKTTPVSTTESTITSTQTKHDCTCLHSHSEPSSMRTAIDKTSKTTSKTSEITSIPRVSEALNVTESITKTINNSTGTLISAGTKRCSCMDTEIPTSAPHLETNIPTTISYSETEESTTLPLTKSTHPISGSVSTSAQTTKSCTCNSITLEAYETITTKTQPESETITILTKPMTSVSGTAPAKCTCMDLKTTPVSTTESTITSTQTKHYCTCSHLHSEPSSMKTAINKTAERTLNSSETTSARVSERINVTESIRRRTYANVSRIPIATECTRGNQNSTSIATSEKQNTDSVTKSSAILTNSNTVITAGTKGRCTCMDTDLPTSLSHLETNSTTTSTYSKTVESSTSPITKIPTKTETVSTSAQTITTKTEKEITTIQTKPMTPASGTSSGKCTCMDLRPTTMPTTESTITTTQTKHGCTCTTPHSELTSISTINDKTTHSPLTKVQDTILTRCDKYPKRCKRPLTWETTARGETRDFFQILRERFGNRVKMLRDTTHWPMRITKPMENNEAFRFGTHNDI